MERTICLYCGSRPGVLPAYAAAAAEFGAGVAERGWTLVYGGGGVGLMGIAARAALAAGGRVVGVIPQALLEREQGLDEVHELIVTASLRERKAIMFERSDSFVALPGGFGTLEELVETLTLRQLRYHNRPIWILNTAGFYDPLWHFFTHAQETGFVGEGQLELITVAETVGQLFAGLERG
ncbi:MAG: TIGR00730 family Rossman fold protein [Oscillochloridaceae bacterium umkhey_bin13]